MKIKCAAIFHDQKIWEGKNHADIIGDLINAGYAGPIPNEGQGFVTDCGNYVSRKAAGEIALKAGQIKKLQWPPLLYSEDLNYPVKKE